MQILRTEYEKGKSVLPGSFYDGKLLTVILAA